MNVPNSLLEAPSFRVGRPQFTHSKKEMRGNLLNMFILNAHFGTSTVMVKRSVFDKVGTFFVDPQMKVGENVDMFLRIATTGNVYYDPDPSVNRLINLKSGDNISKTVTTEKRTSAYAFKATRLAYTRLLKYDIPLSSRLLTYFQIFNYTTKIIHDKFKGEWKP
jgi:GT2 family glycosyltransferase